MDLEQMLTELREVLDESHIDVAWEEPTLLGYLAEGQDRFCEETGYFVDKTNFQLHLVAGQREYPLDDRIIKVKGVFRADGSRLGIYTEYDTFGEFIDRSVVIAVSDGQPTSCQIDSEVGSVIFNSTPTDPEILTLRVWRYSLEDLAEAGAQPEIPRRLRRALIEYAAFKALSHHDLEQQDPVDAKKHWENFMDYVRRGRRMFIRNRGVDNYVAPDQSYVVR